MRHMTQEHVTAEGEQIVQLDLAVTIMYMKRLNLHPRRDMHKPCGHETTTQIVHCNAVRRIDNARP